MGIAKRLNLVMVSAFALLLGCLMFTSLDTAWGLTYQEGDVWIGTDGEQMTPEEAGQWEYKDDSTNGGIWLNDYNGEIIGGKIVGCIPATINDTPVTSLQNTFIRTYDLEVAPEIPNTVVSMYATFNNCTDLTTAPKIPNSVKNMKNTFSYCSSLVNVTDIPDSVIDMSSTFSKCTSLITPPKIGNSVEDMYKAFSNCISLTTPPVIPKSVRTMDYAFEYCQKIYNQVVIPDTVESANYLYNGCTEDDDGIIDTNEELANAQWLNVDGEVMSDHEKQQWSLTSYFAGDGVIAKYIGTFQDGKIIGKAPEYAGGIPVTDMVSCFANNPHKEDLIYAPTLPNKVQTLDSAFSGCINLETPPIIPASVRSMDHCFDYCQKIYNKVIIPETVTSAEGLYCGCTEVVDPSPDEGEDEEQDPTTPSNPGETSGNMSIYGTVQPITMIDVTVPLTIQFTIESDRTFTGPDSIEIKSNCPSPLDVNLYGVNKDDGAPSLVAPDTHSDDEWNNLSRAETLASIALMLDNTSLSSTGSTLGRIDSAFQSEKALDLDLSAKYGKAWDNSEDLVFTYNVVFEFAMP